MLLLAVDISHVIIKQGKITKLINQFHIEAECHIFSSFVRNERFNFERFLHEV